VSELPARTWSDNTGQYKIEGEFVQLAAGHVDLRRDDGKLVRIPLEKLSPADQEADQEYAAKMAGNRVPNPFETRKDESQQEEATVSPPHAVDERTLEVVATGYGATDEEAKRNAFRNAIEQAVGVYVDATTIVANDEVIEDKVLTYSDAFIASFDELKSGTSGGLRMKKIKAQVAVQRLTEKLQSQGIRVVSAAVSGQNLAAEAVTKGQRQQDMLKNGGKAMTRTAFVSSLCRSLVGSWTGITESRYRRYNGCLVL
jgi:hypothetical protein